MNLNFTTITKTLQEIPHFLSSISRNTWEVVGIVAGSIFTGLGCTLAYRSIISPLKVLPSHSEKKGSLLNHEGVIEALDVLVKEGFLSKQEVVYHRRGPFSTSLDPQGILNKIATDPAITNKLGQALLIYAQTDNCLIVKGLLNLGANIEAETQKLKETPLLLAVIKGQTEVAKILIDAGAQVNTFDKDGYTPLMQACIANNKTLVSYLLKKGADKSLINTHVQTAAELTDYIEINKLLN